MSKMLFFAQNRRMGPPPQFSVQPTSLSFGYSSSSKQLTINSNYPWTYVSGETSWCTIDTKSGDGEGADTINVSVTENTSTSQTRSATLLFKNEKGLEGRVTVSQAVHEAYTVSVQPTSVTLQKASGSQASITISANQGWSISGTPAWATLSKSSGTGNDTVTITAASENTSTDERSATLTITGSQSGSATVSLKQNATEVVWSVSPESISIEADDTSDHALTITSNTSWTITGYPDWVQVSKSSGTGNDTVNVKAKSEYTGDEQRSGTIAFKNAKGSTINVTITQSAATITYSDVTVSISYGEDVNAAGSNSVTPVVTYSQTWGYNGSTTGGGTITTGGSLSFEKTSGNGTVDTSNGKVSASSKGTTVSERTEAATVKVTVSLNGKTGTAQATCYQEANQMTGYTYRKVYSTNQGSTWNTGSTITVGSDLTGFMMAISRTPTYTSGSGGSEELPWSDPNNLAEVTDDASWINSMTYMKKVTAAVQVVKNTSTSSRTGTVTLEMEGQSYTITITQEGAENYLEVSPQTLSFEASGGTKEITIDTNESWTIS